MPNSHRRKPSHGRARRWILAPALLITAAVCAVVALYPHGSTPGAQAAAPVTAHTVAPNAAVAAPVATAPATTATTPPTPPVNACLGNTGQEVLVSIANQHVWLCSGATSVADYPVTTGRHADGDETPTGVFQVQALTRNTTLNPSSGGAYPVKYWIPFKWGMYGFHDASWQRTPFGSPDYVTDGSQGCVHMRTADIAHLFSWVHLGTRVRVEA